MEVYDRNIRCLPGIGDKKLQMFEKLGVTTLRDLLCLFPRAYEDRRHIYPLSDAPLDMPVCVRAMAADVPVESRSSNGKRMLKLRCVDERNSLDITFFNQIYLKNVFKTGHTYIFYGKLSRFNTRLQMVNPEFSDEERDNGVSGRILPVYPLTAGLGRKAVSAAIQAAMDVCGNKVPDALPSSVVDRLRLAPALFSYRNIHNPEDEDALAWARTRLMFEELFVLAAALATAREQRKSATSCRIGNTDISPFLQSLPYRPTGAQSRAIEEALTDLSSGAVMNRLLQGDVGSGKTLVAAALIYACVQNGYQAAFMAPTEILAEQHYNTLTEFFRGMEIPMVLLTGSAAAGEKQKIRESLKNGETKLAVGTHALISDAVEFQNLALVITDEQHRFGVKQRSALADKGLEPHLYVMSATPIPRSLALIIYGDLDVSILNELPPGRQKVPTYAVDERMRPRIQAFVRKLVAQGRQVFWVCPRVEENEESTFDLKSAEPWARELGRIFPELRVACLHGKMKSRDKEAIMAAFVAGKYDILVSTTVIEVGVDVPNAALMIVENAERFGLSQLHQLRGRVGRGQHQSYCVLFSEAVNEEARQRLDILSKTNDGFVIAEEDLKLRGPGEFFGDRQHGLPEMKCANLFTDTRIMKLAREEAAHVLAEDPELTKPENQPLAERLHQLYRIHAREMN